MLEILWTAVLIAILAVIIFKMLPLKRVVVFEFQRGLKYRNGKFQQLLQPGQHWIWKTFSSVTIIDIRPQPLTVQGQEVLCSDGVNVKISLAAEYEVADPPKAINSTAQYQTSLYLQLQSALRDVTAGMTIDEFTEKRTAVNERLLELSSGKAKELGLNLKTVTVKDVMFSGEMKRVFAQVTKAKKEGLAALEKARGETAALRNLANAARMMEETPALLQLRALQMMGESAGNTLVLGVDKATLPIKNNGAEKI